MATQSMETPAIKQCPENEIWPIPFETVEQLDAREAGLVRIDAPGLTTGELWLAELSPTPPASPALLSWLEEVTKEEEEGLIRIDAPGLTTGELWLVEPIPMPPASPACLGVMFKNPAHRVN